MYGSVLLTNVLYVNKSIVWFRVGGGVSCVGKLKIQEHRSTEMMSTWMNRKWTGKRGEKKERKNNVIRLNDKKLYKKIDF